MARETTQSWPRLNTVRSDSSAMRASVALVALAVLLCAPLAHALPPAKDYDAEPHAGADFPMGTVELTTSIGRTVSNGKL